MSTAAAADQGFFAFYREYAHTGIHAASTAGLTAFGLLTFVHRAFVVLAIGVYVLPPIYLYLTRDGSVETVETVEPSEPGDVGETAASTDSSETAGSEEPTEAVGSVDSADAPRPDEPSEADASVGSGKGGGSPDAAAVDSTIESGNGTGSGEPTAPGSAAAGADANERSRTTTAEAGTTGSEGASDSPDTTTAASVSESDGVEAGVEDAVSTDSDPDPDLGSGSGSADRASEGEGGAPADGETPDDEPTSLEWVEVDSPTDETLSDVVAIDSSAYAVGSNGVLLARNGGWETVLEHGPSAESNALVGVDAADDGAAVWFTGDSGALGRYDAEAGRHTDHSAPNDLTDNWVDVAVAGPAGKERVYLVNGSGQVLAGEFDGSEVEWGDAVKPGSGSSMSAIEFVEGAGYCCDTNSGVYETTDGESFERIGVEGGGSFTAIAAAGPNELAVSDADGSVSRYDGSVWTRLHAADVALDALSTDGTEWFAAGDGGTIRELADGSWEPRETPLETNLHGVAVGEPSAAVGAEGTIIELRPAGNDD